MYSLSLVAALVVMAGVIAVIGDRVGRAVGRRRLSLFGLRPRHTSVIVTVATGVLIAAASLGLMVAVSAEVRLALFRIDEVLQALARYRRELGELQQELDRQQALLQQANRARDEAERRSQQAIQQRELAERQLQEARGRLEQVQGELASARSQLAEAEKALARARQDLEFQMGRVGQLKQLGETLAGRVESLQRQVAALEATERELSEAIITLWNAAQRLQYGSVAYRRGELILASVLDPQGNRQQAQAQLLDFLKRVEAAAQARLRSAGRGQPEGVEGGVVRISPEEFNEAVQAMAQGRGPWVVRAWSLRNTPVGEPVAVQLELVPRGLAYRKGQVVAEALVDETAGQPVENQVLDLLRLANELAVRYGGMVTGPDGTVGKLVSADEFARVVAELRQAPKPVRLLAVAAADTFNTEGPLQIRLQLEAPDKPGGVGAR